MRRGETVVVSPAEPATRRWTVRAEDLEVRDREPQESLNLLGKVARWRLFPHARGDVVFDFRSDADADPLTIEDPENGLVRLDLTGVHTDISLWNGRYYLTLHDGDWQGTAITGRFVVTS